METVRAPTIRWNQLCKRLNVGYWHEADMLNALTNVCFGGKADMARTCQYVRL